MVLAAGGFSDNLGIGPLQTSEMIGQSNASETGGGRRSAAFADRDLVVDTKRQGNDFLALCLKNLAVSGEDQVIFQVAANFLVAAGYRNGEGSGCASVNGDIEIHCQGSGIEGRSQIGRGRWEGDM